MFGIQTGEPMVRYIGGTCVSGSGCIRHTGVNGDDAYLGIAFDVGNNIFWLHISEFIDCFGKYMG